MVVDYLAAMGLEGGDVRNGRLQRVGVGNHSVVHPLDEGVVGDAFERREVINIKQLHELCHELAAERGDCHVPRLCCLVVGGGGVLKCSRWLPGEISHVALGVEESCVDLLRNGYCFGGDGSVLSWSRGDRTSHLPFATLAKAKAQTAAGGCSAGVWRTDGAIEVKIELAEIGAGDYSIDSSIQRITGYDGEVDDLVHFAGWWRVT